MEEILTLSTIYLSSPAFTVAGILGYGLGKASYIGVCQSKFHSLDDQLRGAGFGPGHNRFVICLIEGL